MATAFSRQFDTGIPFHQPPAVPTRALPFNISVPRLPEDKTPTEDPAEEKNKNPNTNTTKQSEPAAKPKKQGTSFIQKLEEPFVPNSGVNQGFGTFLHNTGHYMWDAFSPNSGFNKDVGKVLNWGDPIKTPGILSLTNGGGGQAAPVESGVGSSTVKSAVGRPQPGFWGEVANIGEEVGSAIAESV